MTTTMTASAEDRALKARHRAMWTTGDYPAVAAEVVGALGPAVVIAAQVGTGDRVLDVAAGTGNAAVAAAAAGADVVATDLAPALLEAGRARSDAAGLAIEWREADAEDLPFADDAFDVVLSSIGVMFAPHHAAAASELTRVCRPGGRLALANWTPEGFVGRLFATMKPYAPAPPPGTQPAPLWGDEAHVAELLGDRVTDLRMERRMLRVDRFAAPDAFRRYFAVNYGPTIAVYRALGDDVARLAALEADLDALAAMFDQGGVLQWEYLVVTARVR